MYRAPHSTGIANQGVNIVDENLEDVGLDPQSDVGYTSTYPISGIITTINSKSVLIYTTSTINIVAGQYIVITFNTTLSGIDPNHIIGARKVLTVSGIDNNTMLIEADAEATASGLNSLGSGSRNIRIKPILSIMPNKTIRFYVTTDYDGIIKYLNVRYHEDGVDYHKDICELNV